MLQCWYKRMGLLIDRDRDGCATEDGACVLHGTTLGRPLAGSRVVKKSERKKHAQAIMGVWKRQADCGGDQGAQLKAKLQIQYPTLRSRK
jgi:hypothetical protein